MFNVRSIDYVGYLHVWYNQIKSMGGVGALKTQIGDYGIPYQTIIALFTYIPIKDIFLYKVFSALFDFWLAVVVGLLVIHINPRIKFIYPYAVTLFLPTILVNSSLWGQADAIYTALALTSLYLLIRDKYGWSFFVLGIAFGFKLQTVFLLPVYILVYLIVRKFSILYFLNTVVGFYLLNLPGILIGHRGWLDPIKIYMGQTGTYKNLTLAYPNLPALVNVNFGMANFDMLKHFFMLLAVGVLAIGYMYAMSTINNLDGDTIMLVSIWTVWTCVMFLPAMHERYGYLLEVMLIVMSFTSKRILAIAGIACVVSFVSYWNVLAIAPFNIELYALIMVGSYIYFTFWVIPDKVKELNLGVSK